MLIGARPPPARVSARRAMSSRDVVWIDSMPVDAVARAAFLRCDDGLQDLMGEHGRVTNSVQVIGRGGTRGRC